MTFLKTETINDFKTSEDVLIMYLQDADNFTQFCKCTPNHKET